MPPLSPVVAVIGWVGASAGRQDGRPFLGSSSQAGAVLTFSMVLESPGDATCHCCLQALRQPPLLQLYCRCARAPSTTDSSWRAASVGLSTANRPDTTAAPAQPAAMVSAALAVFTPPMDTTAGGGGIEGAEQ